MFVQTTSPEIVPVVVQQHVEEAAFLWDLRSIACRAPDYDIHELARLDERVEAHVDGLRVAGIPGWDLCVRELDPEAAGSFFAAGILAFENRDLAWLKQLTEAPALSKPQEAGLRGALGWLSDAEASRVIPQLFGSTRPEFVRMALSVSGEMGHDPGEDLLRAFQGSDISLKSAALSCVGRLGRRDLLVFAREYLHSEIPEVRSAANWSEALLTGEKAAVSYLMSTGSPLGISALQVAIRRTNLETAYHEIRKLQENEKEHRLAISSIGILGDPTFIPWLIHVAQNPELARAAAEAITAITGVDLADRHLTAERPKDFVSGPTEDPADESIAMDADESLAWPDPGALELWWKAHAGEFNGGVRHLLGRPITTGWLEEVLRTGKQRQRQAAALELKILRPAEPLFDTEAPAWRQMRLLGMRP